MFLDEKIVTMILQNPPQSENDFIDASQKVIDLCFEESKELFSKSGHTDTDIVCNLKKVCNFFDLAAKQLEKHNLGFLKVGGFKDLLIHDSNFYPILKKINF